MSQDMNKANQKERWKFVLEKFSHASNNIGKRNSVHVAVEPQLLEMPECKRGKFMDTSDKNKLSKSLKEKPDEVLHVDNQEGSAPSQRSVDNDGRNVSPVLIEEDLFTPACSVSVSLVMLVSCMFLNVAVRAHETNSRYIYPVFMGYIHVCLNSLHATFFFTRCTNCI